MLEPDEAKREYREKIKSMKDAKDIVLSIGREEIDKGYRYHAYNVFGDEIPDVFCEECIKAHPEQFDFSMFDESEEGSTSECKNCKEDKIKLKEN